MKLAFVYAGQGSQHVGMGKDFYEEFPGFANIFDHAPVDFDLKQLCFDGPEERLSQTRFTQPCMAAFAVGVTDLLYQEGIRPQVAAGLSLGEYSALYAAGVFSRGTVIATVAFRGKAMEEAAAGLECGMTAVLGLDREKLRQACEEAAELGVVQICNYNCPGQLVIGGERAAVDRAGEIARELGAKRCMALKVSGPFHTRLMKPAGEALAEHFRKVSFGAMALPVYFNCKGGPMEAGDTVPALLEKQVQSSVCWEDTLRRMAADGVDTAVEIGPGKTLSGFFKKTAPAIKTYHIDTAADFHSVVSALKGELA
ncbi:MAG: ACP S-malonyltransferase [Lawsonibacter sp.]|nr:ACP S-malonyltransferase [Lawsonibacter sp.]